MPDSPAAPKIPQEISNRYYAAIRPLLLNYFGTTDVELLAEVWRDQAKSIEETARDKERVDWLDAHGQIAENNKTARVFAIGAHIEWTLREAVDAAMKQEEGK